MHFMVFIIYHEGIEGNEEYFIYFLVYSFMSFMFFMVYTTKLVNPSFSIPTLKLIRKPWRKPESFRYDII
jgi:hypothetical protein